MGRLLVNVFIRQIGMENKMSESERGNLIDFEYTKAKEINEYLKSQPYSIRKKILDIIREDICIYCGSVSESACHCMNDD
jgi:hypothetical protein